MESWKFDLSDDCRMLTVEPGRTTLTAEEVEAAIHALAAKRALMEPQPPAQAPGISPDRELPVLAIQAAPHTGGTHVELHIRTAGMGWLPLTLPAYAAFDVIWRLGLAASQTLAAKAPRPPN